jgi:hypothetical protein
MELDYYYNTLTGEQKEQGLFGENSDPWTPKAWWLDQ